jgi:anti-anti-sigma factor
VKDADMPLTHSVHDEGAARILSLGGTLTFADNRDFRRIIDDVAASSARELVVDLSDLRSLDSAGLSMLVLLHDRLADRAGTVALRRPPPTVRRMLEVVEFDQLFAIRQ